MIELSFVSAESALESITTGLDAPAIIPAACTPGERYRSALATLFPVIISGTIITSTSPATEY